MKIGSLPKALGTQTTAAPLSAAQDKLHPDAQKEYYQDKFDNHPLAQSIFSQASQYYATPFIAKSGSLIRETKEGEELPDVGPGWWGAGVTLQRVDANLGEVSIAGSGGERSKNWIGPSGTSSTSDPTQTMKTVAQGGKGLGAYTVNLGGGASVGNVEERAYDLFYGGSSQAGVADFTAPKVGYGLGGGGGIQARSDVVDADLEGSVSAGQVKLGDQKISGLVQASGIAQAAVGDQVGAEGMAYIGGEGFGLGGGVSAFSGAQAGVLGRATVGGVGVGIMAQGWAGEGAKANFGVSLKNGVLSFDAGLGAALDVGGYLNVQATVDFNQIAKELEGVVSEGKKLGKDVVHDAEAVWKKV